MAIPMNAIVETTAGELSASPAWARTPKTDPKRDRALLRYDGGLAALTEETVTIPADTLALVTTHNPSGARRMAGGSGDGVECAADAEATRRDSRGRA